MNKNLRITLAVIPSMMLAGLLMSARPLEEAPAAPAPTGLAVLAYPNPFGSYVNVQVSSASSKPMIIAIRSAATGAVLMQQTVTYVGPVGFNTGALPAGGYLITVANTNGHIFGRCEATKQ